MTNDLLTVVTATVGDSASHLGVSMAELRKYSREYFTQIVSDDGTASEEVKERQKATVSCFKNAVWTENPGPTYGISYNLNHLFSMVKTPWVFVLEDAVRPGRGWLETAIDALHKIGGRKWQGLGVGGIGLISSFDHWELEVAGLLPGHLGMEAYFGRVSHDTVRQFWHSDWNDGVICWPRIMPNVRDACMSLSADSWPRIVQDTWRHPILAGVALPHPAGDFAHKSEKLCDTYWPRKRRAWPATTPGSWGLINMEAWRKAGGWREGCCFYEGHLGIRLAQHGYLNVNIDCPPWLHYPSMAFHAVNGGLGKAPRHLEPDNGPQGIFERDFGCNGPNHCDLTKLVWDAYPPGMIEAVRQEMNEVEIYADPAWKGWM